ncbi:tryptophan synthase subunit alpha [Methanosarcinales archaeon]|nr:MAG: tryptophan synthase subunit alpha [Methanosarcinales archaeon]
MGDPSIEESKKVVEIIEKSGADIIELGLPFSDPIADGKVIQRASERALNAGMNPDLFFDLVSELNVKVPLAVMTYYNLVFKRGIERFVRDCSTAGISGIIIPDLPPEEAGDILRACRKFSVEYTGFVTPITTPERIEKAVEVSTGFLYIVSRLGVTGGTTSISPLKKLLERLKQYEVPKAVGFGISSPSQCEEAISMGADGVIVGSAIVKLVGERKYKEIEEVLRKMKEGCLRGLKRRIE